MDYRHILLGRSEGIATITLNRPEVLDAYIPEMGDEIADAFSVLREDDDVRVIILTGAGRGFCAGVDLKYMRENAEAGEGSRRLGDEAFVRTLPLELARYPKPILVAFNGAAIGVGVTMSLPCDIRIAAESAKLGVTFTKLGMLPGLGSTHLLPKLVGLAKALELVLTARVIGAEEAREIGLVSKVVPDAELLSEARAMAAMIAECNPEALARAKVALHHGASSTLESAMKNESDSSSELRRRR